MTSSTRDRDQIIYGTPKNETLIGGNGHDRIYGNSGNDRIFGGDGNDYVEAGAGNDYVSGGDGNDWLDGGDGNDDLKGGDGNDMLLGGAGNDELDGGDGDDWLDGGAGINDLEGNDGNDVFVFRLSDHNSEATGGKAPYSKFDGDDDIDTLRLVLTRDEWLRNGVQSDVARFMTYLADHTNRKGEVSGCDEFKFTAFNLEVEAIERLVIVVDGLEIDPRDEAVIARADALTATEDAASLSVNLLANDLVPDLVRSVTVGTASKGSVAFVQNYADPANPIASVVYTPNPAAFQYLAAGERAYDSFTYTVTDADGDVSTATVTVTILGQNDGPTIVSGRVTGAATEDSAATLADTGTILFQDVDLTDSHTVAVGAARTSVAGATPAGFVPAGGFGALTARVAENVADQNNQGQIVWSFAADNAQVQKLAAGQIATQVYTLTLTDKNGATITQDVTVTLTGTNDGPTIGTATATATGATTEDGIVAVLGNIAFADVDLIDTHAVSFVAQASGYRGAFTTAIDDVATGDGRGNVRWNFAVDNAAIQDLAEGQVLTQRYSVTVRDNNGAATTQVVTVTITGTNDAPVIGANSTATGAVSEAGLVDGGNTAFAGTAVATGRMTSTDVDQGATATWSGARTGAYGSFAIDARTGEWTYTLDDTRAATQGLKVGERVEERFLTTVTDDKGAIATREVVVAVTGSNDGPVVISTAAAASGGVREAGVVEGGNTAEAGIATATGRLTSTDVDRDATATWSGNNNGTFGRFAIDPATGAWSYVLDNTRAETQALKAAETRTETFTATVTDDHGASATQVVTVTVTGTNDVPVVTSTAADATGAVREAGVANGGNDLDAGIPSVAGRLTSTDVDRGATAMWSGNNNGTFGRFAIDPATGAWSYVLDNARAETQALKAGETRTETFTATVTDDHGASAIQVVTVTVTGTNDAPIAIADVDTAVEGTLPVIGSVATNDGDVDGSAVLTYRLDSAVAGLTLSADGRYSFDPDNAAYDSLARGEQLTVLASYTVTDEFGATSSATLTIALTGTNDAPYAVVDRVDLLEDALVTGTVAANDGDVDHGAVLSWALTQPIAGLTLAADGSYGFDARDAAYQSLAQGETLTILASYRVTDENRGFANGTLVVVLTGTNDAPVVTSTASAALGLVVEAGNEDDGTIVAGTSAATGQLTSSDVDHNATATWSGSRDGNYGNFTIGATGLWRYGLDNGRTATQALAEGQSLTETFLATVTDDKGGTATQLVTVTVIGTNDSPLVTSALVAAQGSAVEAGVADGGTTPLAGNGASGQLTSSDVDTGATATWSGSSEGIYGSFAIDAAGAWTYAVADTRAATQALAQGQSVVETFTATVIDDHGATATQVVTVTLTGTNDAPVITSTNAAARGTVVEAGNTDPGAIVAGTPAATGTLTASDVDAGATRSWSGTANGTYGAFAIDSATGVWSYALDNARAATQGLREGQSVVETFTAIVTDEHGATAAQVVTVTVVGTNDSPVVTSNAAAASGNVIEAGNLDDGTIAPGIAVATGILTASDVDTLATARWSGSLNATYGSFAIDATTGAWTYTLDNTRAATQALAEGVTRTESFTATVTDDRGAIATQIVTVTVTGTNDSPVISTAGSGSLDKAATVLNGSQASAVSIDGLFALTTDGNVTNSAGVPHVTIRGTANANGAQTDWYTFTVVQAGQVTLDIDGFRVGSTVVDSWIELYNAAGTRIGVNDDSSADPGSTTGLDSFLSTSLAAGTYSVRVGRFSNSQPLPANLAYTLHVSVEHPLAGSSAAGTVVEAGNLANGSVFAGTAVANGTLIATDVDAGATLSWSGSLNGTYGSFAINAAGTWIYTLDNARSQTQALAAGQIVTESFIATVIDDKGATASRAVTITVTGTNDAPVVTGALTGVATEDGMPVILAALANASDVDTGAVLNVVNVGPLPAGVTYDAATKAFTLDPANAAYQSLAAGQQRTVTITYGVSDGIVSVPTSASWTITGTNDAPIVAGAVTGTVAEDASSTLAALANVSDVDQGAVLAIVGIPGTLPAGVSFDAAARTFTLDAANPAYQYLAPGETATVTIEYGVSDGIATTAASVSWTVTGTNDMPRIDLDVPAPTTNPTAIADLFTLNGSASRTGDANLVQLTPDATSQSGSAISIRKLDFSQSITFDFDVFVGNHDMPGADGVTLVLHNDPRGANATGALGIGLGVSGIQNGLAIEFDTYANDGEPFEDHTSFIRTSDFVSVTPVQTLGNIEDGQFHRVVVAWDATTKTLSYTIDGVPRGTLTGDLVAQYFGGSDTVFFGFTGGTGGEGNLQQVRINAITGVLADAIATNPTYVENAAPVAVTGTNVAVDDWNERDLTSLTVTVSGVRDGAAEQLTLGTATIGLASDASGSLTIGGETFAYAYVAATATLTVTATDGRIAPAALETLIETLRYADVGEAPTAGTRSFGFQLTDASGAVSAVQTARIDVVSVNDAPVATPFANAGSEDMTITGRLIATDVDSATLTYAQVGTVSGLTINADGTYVLDARHPDYQTLAAGETRVVTATYSVGDGIVTSTSTLAITLTGTNDAPVVTDEGAVVTEGLIVAGSVAANDHDVDNSVLTYTLVDAIDGFTLNADGSYSFDAANAAYDSLAGGATRTVTATYAASDGALTTNGTLAITVTGVNDAPMLAAPLVDHTGFVDAPFSYTVPAGSFTDVDGALTYSATLANGAALPTWLAFDAGTRSFSGTPGLGQQGSLDVVVTASDGALSVSDTVRLTVAPNIVTGTSGNDTINGTARSETIVGNGGNDVLNGGAGDDTIWGDAQGEQGPSANAPSTLTATAQSYYGANNSLRGGLGGTAGFGEGVVARNDDGFSSLLDITSVFGAQGLNFFGQNFTTMSVNNNGNLTFGQQFGGFTPSPIAPTGLPPLIAAFWTDIDTRAGTVTTSPGGTSTGSNLVYYDFDTVNKVFTATWDDVGEYSSGRVPNAFQIQLVDRSAGDFDIIFRYETIQWNHGAARAGYSGGGTAYELTESVNRTELDLDINVGNTGIVGVHVFQVRGGQVSTSSNDTINGGAGHDTLIGGSGLDVFVFEAHEANGDTILDFNGSGSAAGDSLRFLGYGTGATFTQIGTTNQWTIASADHAIQDVITFANGASIDPTDFIIG